MIFIRKPAEVWHSKSIIDLYDLKNALEDIAELKLTIQKNKEKVSQILFNIIGEIKDKKERNKLIVLRRNLYNGYEKYDQSIVNLLSLPQRIVDTNLLKIDYILREQLYSKKMDFKKHYQENTLMMRDYLEQLCKNDKLFLCRVKVANYNLYNHIVSGRFGKSQYITLTKYLYKQETCCTPSSFWSGISIYDENKKYSDQYWLEDNRYFVKSKVRNYVVSCIKNNEAIETKFVVNPTVYEKDDYVFFTTFDSKKGKVFRLPCNKTVIDILKSQELSYGILFNIISRYLNNTDDIKKIIIRLIDYNFILPVLDNKYGDYNLEMTSINELINARTITENGKIYSLFLGHDKKESVDKNKLRESVNIYYNLKKIFYQRTVENDTITKIKSYIKEKNRRISLKEFLYESFDFSYTIDIHQHNYKCWSMPIEPDKQTSFNKFINYIKKNIKDNLGKRSINLKWSDLEKELLIKTDNLPECEVIYRVDSDIFCIDMQSSQIGRLLFRYLKYCPNEAIEESQGEFENEYIAHNNIQINLELNSEKDNIGFNIPGVKKCLSLYNRNIGNDSNIQEYTLDDIFLDVNNAELVITDEFGNELNPLFSSTVAPVGHKLYKLLNLIKNGKEGNLLNGQGLTRIELNYDYQPRICVDNLLVSRERFRLDCCELKKELNNPEFYETLLEKLLSLGVSFEFYYYSDSDYKPYYGRLNTEYDVTIIKKYIRECNRYVYFEEIFPLPNTGNYAMEFWEGIWTR